MLAAYPAPGGQKGDGRSVGVCGPPRGDLPRHGPLNPRGLALAPPRGLDLRLRVIPRETAVAPARRAPPAQRLAPVHPASAVRHGRRPASIAPACTRPALLHGVSPIARGIRFSPTLKARRRKSDAGGAEAARTGATPAGCAAIRECSRASGIPARAHPASGTSRPRVCAARRRRGRCRARSASARPICARVFSHDGAGRAGRTTGAGLPTPPTPGRASRRPSVGSSDAARGPCPCRPSLFTPRRCNAVFRFRRARGVLRRGRRESRRFARARPRGFVSP